MFNYDEYLELTRKVDLTRCEYSYCEGYISINDGQGITFSVPIDDAPEFLIVDAMSYMTQNEFDPYEATEKTPRDRLLEYFEQ